MSAAKKIVGGVLAVGLSVEAAALLDGSSYVAPNGNVAATINAWGILGTLVNGAIFPRDRSSRDGESAQSDGSNTPRGSRPTVTVTVRPKVAAPGSTAKPETPAAPAPNKKAQAAPVVGQIIAAGSREMPCKPGEIINKVKTNKKEVALTIDDGPSPSTTARILDVLKQTNSVATFFYLGNRITTPEGSQLVQQTLAGGNQVGVHSYSHHLFSGDKNAAEQDQADAAFKSQLNVVPYAYRAPGFNYSQPLKDAVTASGQCFIGMSRYGDSMDWASDLKSPKKAAREIRQHDNEVIANLSPGTIILVHDQMQDLPEDGGKNRPRTTAPDHVRYLIDKIHAKGYTLVTVDKLLQNSVG